MIQSNAQLPTSQNLRLMKLQRKYRDLCISVSKTGGPELLSAATFVPSSGFGIAFERPIARIGSVLLCTFGQDDEMSAGTSSAQFIFRGYRAHYVPKTGETSWQLLRDWFDYRIASKMYGTNHDERLMRSAKFLDVLIDLADLSIRTTDQKLLAGKQLKHPPTLLGFAPEGDTLAQRLIAAPTRWVQDYATKVGLSIGEAWRALDAMTHLPGDMDLVGLRLIDSRLCVDPSVGSGHLPAVLSVFHDLRPLLGRQYTNPARKVLDLQMPNPASSVVRQINQRRGRACDPGRWSQAEADEALNLVREHIGPKHVFMSDFDLSEALVWPANPIRVHDFDPVGVLREHGEAAVARGLRLLLLRHISEGCINRDLIDAYNNLDAPLIASRVAKRQVWGTRDDAS